MSARLLIADADPVQRRHLEATVNRFGYAAETVATGAALRQRLCEPASARSPAIDLLILDLGSIGGEAADLVALLEHAEHKIPTIIQVAPGAVEAVPSLMRTGIADFIVKPVGAERLLVSLENALHLAALRDEVRRRERQAAGQASFAELVCASESMARVARLGTRAARTQLPVLLEGEAGTGKEMVARAIHGASDRRGRPFVSLDCRALSADLAWTTLFGQDKSGVAGAAEKTPGKILEARGGTLFLDEVGALPLELQPALLRALQGGEIEPLGAKRRLEADVRFIVATTENLIELVTRGRFREDLFYRLNLFPIALPPLRARRDDIGALSRRCCARFAAELGKPIRGIGAEALALLESYDWPGNVRQLENAVYRAVVLAEADELTIVEFPQIAAHATQFAVKIPPPPLPACRPEEPAREYVTVEVRDPNVLALLDESGRMHRLDRLEADAIRFALRHYRGQISAVARGLGIGRSTLYRKMRDYGLGGAEASGAGATEAADPRVGDAAA